MTTYNIFGILRFAYDTDKGKYNSATHKFYSIRKRKAKEYDLPEIMDWTPSQFFSQRKKEYIELKNATDRANRMLGIDNDSFDGDFDDMGRSKMAGQYFGYNKHMRGRL